MLVKLCFWLFVSIISCAGRLLTLSLLKMPMRKALWEVKVHDWWSECTACKMYSVGRRKLEESAQFPQSAEHKCYFTVDWSYDRPITSGDYTPGKRRKRILSARVVKTKWNAGGLSTERSAAKNGEKYGKEYRIVDPLLKWLVGEGKGGGIRSEIDGENRQILDSTIRYELWVDGDLIWHGEPLFENYSRITAWHLASSTLNYPSLWRLTSRHQHLWFGGKLDENCRNRTRPK